MLLMIITNHKNSLILTWGPALNPEAFELNMTELCQFFSRNFMGLHLGLREKLLLLLLLVATGAWYSGRVV